MSDLPYSRKEQLSDDVTLYLGDCREVVPTLGRVSAVVTDPPYGLGDKMQGGTWGAKPAFSEMRVWDQEAPAGVFLQYLAGLAPQVVFWGGAIFFSAARSLLADLEQDKFGSDHGGF